MWRSNGYYSYIRISREIKELKCIANNGSFKTVSKGILCMCSFLGIFSLLLVLLGIHWFPIGNHKP